jgi:hypothetical protein
MTQTIPLRQWILLDPLFRWQSLPLLRQKQHC